MENVNDAYCRNCKLEGHTFRGKLWRLRDSFVETVYCRHCNKLVEKATELKADGSDEVWTLAKDASSDPSVPQTCPLCGAKDAALWHLTTECPNCGDTLYMRLDAEATLTNWD